MHTEENEETWIAEQQRGRILPDSTMEADAQWWAEQARQDARRRPQEPRRGPAVRREVSGVQWAVLIALGAINVFLWTVVITLEISR